MRTIIFIISVFCFFSSSAQNSRKISLIWDKNPLIISDASKINVPHFNAEFFQFNHAEKSIHFIEKHRIPQEIDPSSLIINQIQYEKIELSEINELDQSKISNNIEVKLENLYARNEIFAVLTLNPIIKTQSGYQKIISFEYSYTYNKGVQRSYENNAVHQISNSVLASGNWFRFAVEKTGVYKISRDFLVSLGINMNNTDPRNLKIFGHGGRMAPLLNSTLYENDLTENAIQVIGEQDGVFDANDYILFYAEGVDQWNEESQTHVNLYENQAYYYITTSNSLGKRISNASQPTGAPTMNFNTYEGYYSFEKDIINLGRFGRKWFGDTFGIQNAIDYPFVIPNIITGSNIDVVVTTAAISFNSSSFGIQINNQNIGTISHNPIGNSSTSNTFSEGFFSTSFPAQTEVNLRLNYNNNGVPNARGYLNYIILKTQENLRGNGKQYVFKNNQMGSNIGIGQFDITNASSILEVWDVTDRYNIFTYKNNGQQNFNFKINLGEVRAYLVVDSNDFLIPISIPNPKVNNQNLKGTILNNAQGQFQDLDYLIITAPAFENEAERLAQFHRNFAQLNVKVVTTDKIYHEFSSGKQDIAAIRNFIKYIYFNASQPNNRLRYVNLFGHASFDYKNRVPNNTNVVPIFHSLVSNSPLSSIMSDDFYGMMDPNEGLLNNANGLDIAVGRMLFTTVNQAKDMVNKVLDYHDPASFGRWRNNILLLSDDVDIPSDASIQSNLDDLGDTLAEEKPFYNIKKIHLDSYVQETSSGGQRYPKAKEELLDALQQGVLVFNYFGHGNEDGLTGERIFEKLDAQNINNPFRYPLIVTVTCEFARFDNPYRISGGELTYTNPKGGAVGMVTTTRLITVGSGIAINDAFASSLYGYNTDESITISEALRRAKNNYNVATYMVFYLGDPALKLANPKIDIKLTHINDLPIGQVNDTLKALSFMKFKGEVTLENGQRIENYNGKVSLEVFDKNVQRSTLNNDIERSGLVIMNFETLGNTIFRGNATVENGVFEISFVVPTDIRIPVGNGKVSFYAQRNQPMLENQTGANLDILVGGINENAPADNTPPTVKLYMNDETFISGGITNESPVFLAYLEDENGINTAGGIGHDIIAIIDGDESNPLILNDFYETELNNFRKGIVRFPLRNLSLGLHTIFFRAWDVYNNPITAEIQFLVVGDEGITITNVLNYPNPFVSYTQFWFTHNKPFEPLEVQVQIFTVTGKIVKTINQTVTTDGFLSRDIAWDGRDDFGDKIGKGVYVYKLTVRSTLSNQRAEKYEKLVIL